MGGRIDRLGSPDTQVLLGADIISYAVAALSVFARAPPPSVGGRN